MNYYAADQLARQRHDQFAREASGDNLVRLARNADPQLSQASVGPLLLIRAASHLWRIPRALLTAISRRMSKRHAARESRIGRRPTRPGIV